MQTHEGKIGNNRVAVALGDMTQLQADAFVVPQFTSASSFGGVGGAVARAGGTHGLEEYQRFIDSQGEQKFGTVLLTESGGGNAKHHLHVASVGSPKDDEFNTVQTGFYNALKTAEANGIKSVVAPAMGTGIIGQLESDQSARAMMSAVDQFTKEGGKMDVSFVIYGDKAAYQAFTDSLDSKKYETADRETGKKEFNLGEWVVGMQRDADANSRASQGGTQDVSSPEKDKDRSKG